MIASIITGLWRKLTDRAVYCQKCGQHIGFMTILGPKTWEHVDCPDYAPVRLA